MLLLLWDNRKSPIVVHTWYLSSLLSVGNKSDSPVIVCYMFSWYMRTQPNRGTILRSTTSSNIYASY